MIEGKFGDGHVDEWKYIEGRDGNDGMREWKMKKNK
jgi:hypothetical protein